MCCLTVLLLTCYFNLVFVCIVTVFGFVWLCWFSYFVGWLVGFNLFVCDFSFACLLCVWILIWICVCLV